MTKNSQLKIGVIISYATIAINILINLIYTPLLTSILGQAEYGLYTVVASVVNYLSLFSLGFGGSYIRYYSNYKEKNKQEEICRLNGMFLLVFIFLAICAFITGMFLVKYAHIILGNKISPNELQTARILMLILVINIILTFPSSVFNSIIVSHECYIFQRSVNLLSKIINPLIVLPLLLLGYKSIAVVLVTTIITLCTLVINMFYCFFRLHTKFIFKNLDFKLLKDIGFFSFFIFLNMIIDQINWSIDKFLLIRFSGTVAVAVYGVASQVNSLYLIFSTQISSVFGPRVNQIIAKDDSNTDEILTKLFTKVGRIQFMVIMLILMGFIFFGEYFLILWVGDEYKGAYPVILLLIVPITIPLIQNLGTEIQRAKNMHRFRSIIYLCIALCNVIISIPLTKNYGPVGSAFGTALSLIIGNCIVMNIYYHKKVGLNMIVFWKSIFSMFPAVLPSVIVGVIITKFVTFNSVLNYLLIIILFIFVYVTSMWKIGMNNWEKELVISFISKLKKNKGI